MDESSFPLDPLRANATDAGAEQRLNALRRRLNRGGVSDEKELREACQGFETVFLAKLWQIMRSSVPKEGYLHSPQEDQYMSMFDHELAQKLSHNGGIGLGDLLFDQLKDQLVRASEQTGSEEHVPGPGPGSLRRAAVPAGDGGESRVSAAEESGQAAAEGNAPLGQQVDELARRIEERMAGAGREYQAGAANQARQVAANMPSGLPPLVRPINAPVSSGFGWRQDPFTGEQAWHAGIDMAAPGGTPIRACWPGTVTHAGPDGGYGLTVVIAHEGGWESRYAHNQVNQVSVGDRVGAGERIALVGNTGRSTGPHLHFELRQGALAWDPNQIEQRLLAGLSIGIHV